MITSCRHPGPVLILAFCLLISGCSENRQDYYQGYVEGEYAYIASPLGGQLETLSVKRGDRVEAGTILFSLDASVEAAANAEAQQQLHKAESRLADLVKGLRPSEIAAIEARRSQAATTNDLARKEYERRRELFRDKAVAQEAVDRAKAEMEQSAALIAQLDAELVTAQLGARPDQIDSARAEVKAAQERLIQTEWALGQKQQHAVAAGLVQDTFYVKGEFVPPAYPVVSILPPANIKVRFFVPETVVGTIKAGQKVTIDFDGAPKTYQGTVSFISPQAEYTPPVIYSRKSRGHLVYMIEATLSDSDAAQLNPGQPVDVRLARGNA